MSETIPIAERSPILRLLRGKLPWRVESPANLIAASSLPPEIRMLVQRVVRRVGGWRAERVDVARELLSHFDDAIASGATAAAALTSFGDERKTARLMRRAVRRKRGLVWKSWWWSSRSFATLILVLVAIYGVLAARFFLVSPTITVDSIAELQALTPVGAEHERAWPVLRDALAPLRDTEDGWKGVLEATAAWPSEETRAGTDSWKTAAQALDQHADAVAQLRRAARMPTLGIAYDCFSPEDLKFFGKGFQPHVPNKDDIWSGSTFTILLPYLGHTQRACRWLACDARHAVADGDSARAIEDIDAIVGLARLHRRPFLIDQLVGLAMMARAADLAGSLIAESAHAFSPRDLERLAEVVDRARQLPIDIEFEGERVGLVDSLQRLYSDDGTGDGHLVSAAFGPDGVMTYLAVEKPANEPLLRAASPALAFVGPSRREVRDRFERRISAAERLAREPSWTWTRADWQSIEDPKRGSINDPFHLMYAGALLDDSSIAHVIAVPPAVRQRLDAARLALELVRYEREHGAWPSSLDALDPKLVASTHDMYDGKPLRYAVRSGRPAIWSIGPDRADDGMQTVAPDGFEGRGRWVPPDPRIQPNNQHYPCGDAPLWPLDLPSVP